MHTATFDDCSGGHPGLLVIIIAFRQSISFEIFLDVGASVVVGVNQVFLSTLDSDVAFYLEYRSK